jgi:hypothetical protein
MVETISEPILEDLNTLREVIHVEEGRDASVDDALQRVIDFYGKFVHYQ